MFVCAYATGSCATISRVFFLTIVVIQLPWIPKITRRVCACATAGCSLYTGSWLRDVGVSRVVVHGGVLYDIRVLYLAWLPRLSTPFPPFYFISYMCCVVLQVFLLYITIVVQKVGVFSTMSASFPAYLPFSRYFHSTS